MKVALYCTPNFLVSRQYIISRTSHSSGASSSSFSVMAMGGPGGTTCPGNGLEGARCSIKLYGLMWNMGEKESCVLIYGRSRLAN